MVDSASEITDSARPEADDGDPVDARRSLLDALGLNLDRVHTHTRAAIEALVGEVIALRADRAKLQRDLQAAELLADRDPLCPVFNRRAFERELTREIALSERYGTPLCLIFTDLDHFKLVNDRFGHATGDRVIQNVAQVLHENIRQSDILGRLGGDEFAIALTHAELADSQAKAKALEAAIDTIIVRDALDPALEPINIGASCGVVKWTRSMTPGQLIAQADEAMFRAKFTKKKSQISRR